MSISEFPTITTPNYWRIQTVLANINNLPEDAYVNTWHFVGNGPTDYTLALGWLGQYYNTIGPLLTWQVSRAAGAAQHKVYNLALPRPNPPIDVVTDTIPAPGGSEVDMPGELSLVLSYQAPEVAGQVQRRRRGRSYVGPFALTAQTDYSRPPAYLITAIEGAGQDLFDDSDGATNCKWAVFSPTNAGGWMIPGQSGPPNLANGVAPVDNGWVDNAWDTQRRRGNQPTTRSTFG